MFIAGLTEAQASRLTEAAAGGASRELFVQSLHAETGLSNTWTEGFLPRTPTSRHTPEKNGQLS